MLFEAVPPLPLLFCTTCRSTGFVAWRTCPTCRGMSVGMMRRGRWLFWAHPLERYQLALQKARRTFNRVRFFLVLLIALQFWFWAGWTLNRSVFWREAADPWSQFLTHLTEVPSVTRAFFWLGVLTFGYLWYRSLREQEFKGLVEHYEYKKRADDVIPEKAEIWPRARTVPRRLRHNIADSFTDEALHELGEAYTLADKNGFNAVTPFHLFYELLSSNRISNIFVRLGISTDTIQASLKPLFHLDNSTTGGTHTAPVAAPEIFQIIFNAYEEAYEAHQDYVSVTELLVTTIKAAPQIQEILYELDIDKQKLLNVVAWARIKERLYRQYLQFRTAARHRSKYGMDKAMTAVQTPYLNRFSDDLTLLAQFGRTNPCVAREKEIEEIFQVVDGGQQHVLLVGDYGTGKRSIVEGIAEKMVQDDVPERLRDKRLVRLSIASLLAGTTASGAMERLQNIVYEISRAGNIILLIHNLHELMGVSAGTEGSSSDVASTLAEYLSEGRFMTIATTTTEAFGQDISHSKLSTLFTKVEIGEMDVNQAIQVLESKVGYVEYKQKVFFAYDAVAKAVELSKRFIREVVLPGSALEVMTEAAILAKNKKGVHALVTAEEVELVVSDKTKIPVASVTADETTKLLHLEEVMHKRVIGQDEAVSLVANALRRSRAEIRSTTRPIANFLFLGPTGVGKTELAKTIAEVYFGGEERMTRLDMSEYQDKSSISRLIGTAGEKGSGVLTEAIRHNPFALLLLDEVEKADKDILNLFLQVMDDGRLTDSTGRVVDFTNVILIATSNAGTSYVQEQMRAGLSSDAIKDRLLHGELGNYFRPEFLNRFDGIVLFKPLEKEGIKQIAALMLKRVAKDLEAKGIELQVEDSALSFFAEVGFDPEFGARPLRRALQERVENQLAELVLGGKLKRKDKIIIGAEGKISVSDTQA